MLKTFAAASAVTLITAMSGPSAPMQAAPYVEEPPAMYAGIPDRPFVVVIGTPTQIDAACGAATTRLPGTVILACTFPAERVILLPHCEAGAEAYCGALWRHEVAHLNGWRH